MVKASIYRHRWRGQPACFHSIEAKLTSDFSTLPKLVFRCKSKLLCPFSTKAEVKKEQLKIRLLLKLRIYCLTSLYAR